MKEAMQRLREASIQAILESDSPDSLENLRVKYLGKKGELTAILRQMGKLSAEERHAMGQLANQLRSDIEASIEKRRAELGEAMLAKKLEREALDVTMPGEKPQLGHKHPMYNVLDQIKEIFIGMGFEIVDGPEVELADYNFTKLNIDEGHPSREWTDTFYFTEDSKILLRTQTSPMQIHAMEAKELPIRMIAPGRVYRKDEVDATHSPMFHQIEGMVIDKGVTMADLKATLNLVVEKIYGKGTMKAVPKQLYTGEGIEPEVDVYVKVGKTWTKVDESLYTVSYVNNVELGTARILVNGDGEGAVGSRKGSFKITKWQFNLLNLLNLG